MPKKKPFYGINANEDWTLFIYNRKSTLPIIIENIGITHANPEYLIERQNSEIFVFEYVLSGIGYIEIGDKKYKIEAGDVYCLEPGLSYSYYSDKNNPLEKLWINFYSDLFIDIFKSFNLTNKVIFKNTDTLDLFNEIQSLKKLSNFSDDICYEIAPILFKIVCQLSKVHQQEKIISKTAAKVKQYLDEALYSYITMEDIANKMNLTKSHVIREFAKYYGCSPYNYLIDQKIAVAKKMLTFSMLNIQEISDALAFNDSHYFSRLFKKKTGLSPQQYKTSKLKKK